MNPTSMVVALVLACLHTVCGEVSFAEEAYLSKGDQMIQLLYLNPSWINMTREPDPYAG